HRAGDNAQQNKPEQRQGRSLARRLAHLSLKTTLVLFELTIEFCGRCQQDVGCVSPLFLVDRVSYVTQLGGKHLAMLPILNGCSEWSPFVEEKKAPDEARRVRVMISALDKSLQRSNPIWPAQKERFERAPVALNHAHAAFERRKIRFGACVGK